MAWGVNSIKQVHEGRRLELARNLESSMISLFCFLNFLLRAFLGNLFSHSLVAEYLVRAGWGF